jgi:ABC-type microcin C transport system duplicated ATPase subunit YejF
VFQKKCFDRMEEIIDEGHAAIMVSHTMPILQRMSQVCMWLRHGQVEMFGPSHAVVSEYEKQTTHEVVSNLEKQTAQQQDAAQSEPIARLCSWKAESKVSKDLHTIISSQERVTFHFEVELAAAVPNGKISVSLADVQGLVLSTHSGALRQTKGGKFSLALELPLLPIKPGEYILSCAISDGTHSIAFLRAIPELTVLEESTGDGTGYHGVLNLPAKLSVK